MSETIITNANGEARDLRRQILTQRDLIRDVVERWQVRYWEFDSQGQTGRNEFYRVARKLKNLDVETAAAAQVEEIVGGNSLTTYVCDSCDKRHGTVILIGTYPPDTSLSTAMVCATCLNAARAALGGEGRGQ